MSPVDPPRLSLLREAPLLGERPRPYRAPRPAGRAGVIRPSRQQGKKGRSRLEAVPNRIRSWRVPLQSGSRSRSNSTGMPAQTVSWGVLKHPDVCRSEGISWMDRSGESDGHGASNLSAVFSRMRLWRRPSDVVGHTGEHTPCRATGPPPIDRVSRKRPPGAGPLLAVGANRLSGDHERRLALSMSLARVFWRHLLQCPSLGRNQLYRKASRLVKIGGDTPIRRRATSAGIMPYWGLFHRSGALPLVSTRWAAGEDPSGRRSPSSQMRLAATARPKRIHMT
jgi:hypothetical protein